MRAVSICASLLSVMLLLHCLLIPSDLEASKERMHPRKLLQSSGKAQVFHAAAAATAATGKTLGVEVSDNLKKQTPSKSNPIQN
ncbi:hypothetical protein ACP70R_036569 [Stipagrostis hirtigluma subsp. patula]